MADAGWPCMGMCFLSIFGHMYVLRLLLILMGTGALCTACYRDCSYAPPPGVQITPMYIITQSIGNGPPIQFIPQSDTVLQAAGETQGAMFYAGGWDGIELPLDYTRNEILYYFVHKGDTNTLRLHYDVEERWIGNNCGMATEFKNLRILTHDFVDCRITDNELRIYYQP
jgi:hypothetical protein